MVYLPFACSAAVIFNGFGVVEILCVGAESLAICGVAGGDWTGLSYIEYGCAFKRRGYDYHRPLGCVRSFTHTT
jgi:hypothetical protein